MEEGRRTYANIMKYVRMGTSVELRQHGLDGRRVAF